MVTTYTNKTLQPENQHFFYFILQAHLERISKIMTILFGILMQTYLNCTIPQNFSPMWHLCFRRRRRRLDYLPQYESKVEVREAVSK